MKLDLYSLVEKEYKDINKHFIDFARDKMIEGMYQINSAQTKEYMEIIEIPF